MIQYVFYDDTDCGGIVYHARYFAFCERARSLLFYERGLSPHNLDNGFVVQSIESQFIKTLQIGDLYQVKTIPLEIKSASLKLKQEIYKIGTTKNRCQPQLVFSMQVKLAHVDLKTKRACKITTYMQDILKDIFCENQDLK